MADPAQLASNAASKVKRVHPVIITLVLLSLVVFIIYRRHKQAMLQAEQNDAAATADQSNPDGIDPNTGLPYSEEDLNNAQDQSFLSGMDSGLYDNLGGLPTDIFGGVNSGANGYFPNVQGPAGPAGASGPPGAAGAPKGPDHPPTNHQKVTSGGGAPNRPNVHYPPGNRRTLPPARRPDNPGGTTTKTRKHRPGRID